MTKCLDVCMSKTYALWIVVVALGYTDKGRYRFVGWVINDRNTTLGIFVPEFSHKGESTCAVDVGVYLRDELVDEEGACITCVIVTVEDDVDDDVDKCVACIV